MVVVDFDLSSRAMIKFEQSSQMIKPSKLSTLKSPLMASKVRPQSIVLPREKRAVLVGGE